jgi:hypothetical protein
MTDNLQPNNPAVVTLHQVTGTVVIYARVATEDKLHQNATAQTVDLVALLKQLGFSEDHIIVIASDN